MAPRAESVVVVADVGRTLSDAAGKEVLRIAQAVINNKVLYGGANDSVAVVLFGTTKTGNALHQEMVEGGEGDQYVDILVVHGKYPQPLATSFTASPSVVQSLGG